MCFMRILKDILVVAIEQAVAAPIASAKLADMGARVIKIERPEGDFARNYDEDVLGQSSYFVWINRGKQSCRLNLKNPDDHKLLSNILSEADVFLQNLAPGAMTRLGFGTAELRRLYPKLIICDISGYSRNSQDYERKAYDLLIQAEAGLSALTGTPQSGPARVGVSICDIVTGHAAYSMILEALLQRKETGQGMHLEVSLFDTMAEIMNVPYLQRRYGGKDIKPAGLAHPTIAPYGSFQCEDGQLVISIQNEAEWIMLCRDILCAGELAEDPRFVDNVKRVENREILDELIQQNFITRSIADLTQKLDACRIAYGRISTLDDLINHRSASFAPISTPAGSVDILSPPGMRNGERLQFGAVPALGEHDYCVRQDFSIPKEKVNS